MSIYVITEVFERSRSKGNARLIMLAMADSAHKETGETTYGEGVQSIADMANVSTSTVKRQIGCLIEMGELVVVEQGGGRGHVTRWRVNVGRYRMSPVTEDGERLNLVDNKGGQIEPLSTKERGSKQGHNSVTSEPLSTRERGSKQGHNRPTSEPLSESDTSSSSINHPPRGGKAASADPESDSLKPYHVEWANTMVTRWIHLKGGVVTRSDQARWHAAAREFCLLVDGQMPDDFLPRAHRHGVREPGGWAAFMRDEYAPANAPRADIDRSPTPDHILHPDGPADPVDPATLAPEFRRFLDKETA